MSLYRANFDYESELFWDKSDTWAVEMLEHLFFFCVGRESALFTSRVYQDDYLGFIRDAIGFMPRIHLIGKPENWWGKLENLSLEQTLNSKVTSFEIGKKLGLNHSSSVLIKSIEELEKFFFEKKDIFLRHPYERSGRISFRLNELAHLEKSKEKLIKILKEQPLLGDLYFEDRHWDLGTGFVQKGERFEIEYQAKNLNDDKGVFRGAVLLENTIAPEELTKIAEAYYHLGAREYLQVDSFAYDDGINWLCEVNYRRTMGYIVHKLKRLCPPGQSVAFLITPSSWIKKYQSHSELMDELEDIEGIFPLSPVQNPLFCWLVTATDRDELLTVTRAWWEVVAKNSSQFPEVFNKILPDSKTPVMGSPI